MKTRRLLNAASKEQWLCLFFSVQLVCGFYLRVATNQRPFIFEEKRETKMRKRDHVSDIVRCSGSF